MKYAILVFLFTQLYCPATPAEPWYSNQTTPNFDSLYLFFKSHYPYGNITDGNSLTKLNSSACPKNIQDWNHARSTIARSVSGSLENLNSPQGVSQFIKTCGLGPNDCLQDFALMATKENEYQKWASVMNPQVNTLLKVPLELRSSKAWDFFQKGPVSIQDAIQHIRTLSPTSKDWIVFATRGSFGGIDGQLGNFTELIETTTSPRGRIIIAIPGNPARHFAFPYREDQGTQDDLSKPRTFFRNLSLVTDDKSTLGAITPYITDFKIPSSPGAHLKHGTSPSRTACIGCHMKGGISLVSRDQSQWQFREEQQRAHGLLQNDLLIPVLRGEAFGPALGPVKQRSDKQITDCIQDFQEINLPKSLASPFPGIHSDIKRAKADQRQFAFSIHKIKTAMNCSECHKSGKPAGVINTWTLGRHKNFNGYTRWNILKNHILSGDMPKNSKFTLKHWERRILVHCLSKELYGEQGFWHQLGNNNSCADNELPDGTSFLPPAIQ